MSDDGTGASRNEVRLMAKVAHLYHVSGLRQRAIAEQLKLSQSRVSRLLRQAEEAGIIRTVVVVPEGLFSDIEQAIEARFGLRQAWVVDVSRGNDEALNEELGREAAAHLAPLLQQAVTVGFSSWSRTLRATVEALTPMPHSHVQQVVEMLGDLGRPSVQHESSAATHRLARLCGAEAQTLRVPGIARDAQMRQALLEGDPYAQGVLRQLGHLDLALVGIGTLDLPQDAGHDVAFTPDQLARLRASGVVGQINMSFLDAAGRQVPADTEQRVIGGSLEQLAGTPESIAVAGGAGKHEVILAALRGRWVTRLVTDLETAEYLLD